jgi:hypothetical protein
MSALGQKQTSRHLQPMSALPPKADIRQSLGAIRPPGTEGSAAVRSDRPDSGGRSIELVPGSYAITQKQRSIIWVCNAPQITVVVLFP